MKSVEIFQLNNYERPDPKLLLNSRSEYITNGVNNSYFVYVEDRYLGSPTNQAIIDNYVNYVIGEGLKAVSGISQEDLDSIIDEEDLRLLITEFKTQGNAPIQIVYANIDEKKVAKIYSLPAKTVAVKFQEDLSKDIQMYGYSFDWSNRGNFLVEDIPAFNKGDEKTEILYIKRHSPQPIYALPDYQSGLQYCEVEEEMSNYFVNHIKNNFSAGKIININQGESYDEETEEEARRLIKNQLTGSSNAGKIIVSFNKDVDSQTTVENIEITDAYKQFETLSEESRQKIMLSHKVTNPSLFGFANSTGFSDGGAELDVSLKILYRSQINPMRRVIIKNLERVLKINNPDVKIEFMDFEDLNTFQ